MDNSPFNWFISACMEKNWLAALILVAGETQK